MPEKKDDRPLLVMRRGAMLVPVAPLDSDALMELPAGKPLRCRLTQRRNLQRLRLYWAFIGLIADNMPQSITKEDLHEAIKVRLGLYKPVTFKGGETVKVPLSIAFDEMEEGDFQVFLDKFLTMIRAEVIPGLSRPAFEKAAREMLGEAA